MDTPQSQTRVEPLGAAHRKLVISDGSRYMELYVWGTATTPGDAGGSPGSISVVGELEPMRALVLRPADVRILLKALLEVNGS